MLQNYRQSSNSPPVHSCSQKAKPTNSWALRWWASLPLKGTKKRVILTSINNQDFSRVLVALVEGHPQNPVPILLQVWLKKNTWSHTSATGPLVVYAKDGWRWLEGQLLNILFYSYCYSMGPCIIYCTLCKPSSTERIINFLSGFTTAIEFLALHQHSDTLTTPPQSSVLNPVLSGTQRFRINPR